LLICPSVCPLLQGSNTAFRTASWAWDIVLAKRTRGTVPAPAEFKTIFAADDAIIQLVIPRFVGVGDEGDRGSHGEGGETAFGAGVKAATVAIVSSPSFASARLNEGVGFEAFVVQANDSATLSAASMTSAVPPFRSASRPVWPSSSGWLWTSVIRRGVPTPIVTISH
jgi:hypothetical protein